MAVYAGFFVFNNIVRPIRLAVAVTVSPQFDRLILLLQEKWRLSRSVAITVLVLLANVVGTISAMCAGIALASLASGVPIFPPS